MTRRFLSCVALAIALLLVTVSQASALSKHVFSTSFGGEGASALTNPSDVEVDQATGDLYVTDPANFRVEKFSASGEFVLMFGKEVNKTTGGDVCTAESGNECQPGAEGTTPGAFTDPEFLAVDNSGGPSAGDIYVTDYISFPGKVETFGADVQKFSPQGNLVTSWARGGLLDGSDNPSNYDFSSESGAFNMNGIAVDSSGKLFVLSAKHYFVFAQDGTYIVDFMPEALQAAKGGQLDVNQSGSSLSVDGADNLYTVDRYHGCCNPGIVQELAPFEQPLEKNLTHQPGRYLGDPIVGTENEFTDLGIDPFRRDLYLTLKSGQVEHFLGSCTLSEVHCPPLETFGSGHLSNPEGVAIDGSSGAVYVADAGNHRVTVFSATPYLPDLTASAETSTSTSQKLSGRVDPAAAGAVKSCHFQYVAEADSFANDTQTLTLTGATGGTYTLTATTATVTGTLQTGSDIVSNFKVLTGALHEGDTISGPGIPANTILLSGGSPGSASLGLSASATSTGTQVLTAAETTAPIEAGASAEAIQEALGALSGIGAGNVAVSGPPGGPYTVKFTGSLAKIDIAQLSADSSALTPPGATVTPATTTEGGAWSNAAIVPCTPEASPGSPFEASTPVSAEASGLTYGTTYHYRLLAENANGPASNFDQTFESLPLVPGLGSESVSEVHADTALVHAQVNPNGGDATFHTTYHVEYVDEDQFKASGFAGAGQSPDLDAGGARVLQNLTAPLSGLTPNTTYHYRVVAENASGTAEGLGRTFTTLPFTVVPNDTCANAHVRQQTGAAQLLDCRAYELVSAADAGGYDVESDLIAGQSPFGSYPQARGRVLYGVHGGGIPGTDHPTNRGVDPYVATRGEEGWSTEYVGVRADNPFSAAPFSSTPSGADAGLTTFAFGGPGGCSPCFESGYTGIPVHMPDGKLVQGMVASGVSAPPASAEPDGHIAEPFSTDGSHFVFGSTSRFAEGGNDETGDVSIYDGNLNTGQTKVVSNDPSGNPLACLQGTGKCNSAEGDANGIAELAISNDGSRIVLGQKVSEDGAGNAYYHLYMAIDDAPQSMDLTPGTTSGALYDGMTKDGSKLFFTTKDPLTGDDHDTSPDIYRADVSGSAATLTRVSTGAEGTGDTDSCDPVANSAHPHWNSVDPEEANCGTVAIGGGGGVASGDGTVYFISPERLDGAANGTQDAPNLYLARPGSAPRFVTTLESVLTGSQPPKLKRSFDHDFGSFTAATGLAVDHSSGDVYVLDAGANAVEKFDAEGNPVNFNFPAGSKEPPGNQLKGADTPAGSFAELFFGLPLPTQLAVDQSNGALYVPDIEHNVVDKFSSSGEWEGQVEATAPAGVAVDPSNGDLYVAGLFGTVYVFDSSGSSASQFSTEFLPTSVAVDPAGKVYLTQFFGGAEVYDASGNFVRKLDPNPSQSVSVDPSNGDVYVDEGEQIARYDSAGNRLEALGAGHLSGSVGVTVDPEGSLYASNSGGAEVAVFPASLAPDLRIDNPAVLDSVSESAAHRSADFQVSPAGEFAVFPSTLALAGGEEETDGHTVLYRYDANAEKLDCVSCTITGTPSAGDSSLASEGLSLADDGRVFFTSADPLAAADADNRRDAYQWEAQGAGNCQSSSPAFIKASGACLALISAGTGTFASGFLGASADGTDAYFFSRDSLAPQDKNGPTMKIYDARSGGGFPYLFPPVGCKASDECHGVASPAPGPIQVRSVPGSPINTPTHRKCKPGFVRRHGKCVKKHHHHKRHHHRGGGK